MVIIMSDYVVSFDENGQPYIAHAFWNRSNQNGSKKDHKYFEKIKNGLKTRYFYSKQEWDAYQRNQSSGVRSSAPDNAVRVGVGTSSNNRPVGHAKKITGSAKEGSVYKRGDGRHSSEAVTGGTGFVPKNQKQREYAEAVEALSDYKKKQIEAKRARTATKDNFKEYMKDVGATEVIPAIQFKTANTKRDMKAAIETSKKANREQMEAAKKFFKETGDFAKEAFKDTVQSKKDQIRAEFQKHSEDNAQSVQDIGSKIKEKAEKVSGLSQRKKVKEAQEEAYKKALAYAAKDLNALSEFNKALDESEIKDQDTQRKIYDEIMKDVENARQDMEDAYAYADKLIDEYKKTPIGAVEYSIDSVGVFFDKYFNKKN